MIRRSSTGAYTAVLNKKAQRRANDDADAISYCCASGTQRKSSGVQNTTEVVRIALA